MIRRGTSTRDLYLCPAREELHRAGKSGKGIKYRADTSACRDCPLKERCTPGEGVRNINRYPNEEYVERVRAYRGTEPYEKALRKRGVWVEPERLLPLLASYPDAEMERFCYRLQAIISRGRVASTHRTAEKACSRKLSFRHKGFSETQIVEGLKRAGV